MTWLASGYGEALQPSFVIIMLAVAVLPWVNRNNTIVRSLVLGICLLLGWRYMAWRLWDTIPPVSQPLNFALGALFVGIECLALIGTTITNVYLTRIKDRTREADRNRTWLHSLQRPPRVDVLICTYNEDQDVLEPTILGAVAMKYPNFRVWVCDDGRRDWLQAFCRDQSIGYLTRDDNKHAKAGNINASLIKLAQQELPPDFVAILDADFVPMSDFLERTVSLMRPEDVGVVQTPQHFVNPDPVQSNLEIARVWPDEQRFFFDTVMACRDAWGVAFCCGTSSLIRFSALMQIGGFPTDSVTEDYLLTLRLQEAGFRTIYLNEVLSLGLAPEGLKEYYGQRSRWCLGAVQIFIGWSNPFNFRNKLPLAHRVSLIDSILFWFAGHAMRLLALIIPPAFLLFGIKSVIARPDEAISYVVPFLVAQATVLIWLTEGRILPVMSELYGTLCASEVLKAIGSGVLKPKGQKFKVTAKGGDRSRLSIQWPVLNIFLFYLALNVAGIVKAFWLDPSYGLSSTAMMAWIWSSYNIIVLILACLVCIEQPQRRHRHRFLLNSTICIQFNGKNASHRTRNISVSGLGLIGQCIAPLGASVKVTMGSHQLDATVVRGTPGGFALAFEPSLANRAKVIQFIFARRYAMAHRSIDAGKVLLAVGARLFR